MNTELHDEHVREYERHQVASEWKRLRALSPAERRKAARLARRALADALEPFGYPWLFVEVSEALEEAERRGTLEQRRIVDAALERYTRVCTQIETDSPRLV